MTAENQASLSLTNTQSLLKLMFIESVTPSNHLILCRPLLLLPSIFPSIRVFSMSQLFSSGGQSIGASASTSVLPMNIQAWLPLGLTGLISLLFKGLFKVFCNSTVQKYRSSVLSCVFFFFFNVSTLTSKYDYWKSHIFDTWTCFTIINRAIDSNSEESLGANWVVPLLLHDLTVQTLWPFITIFYIYCWLTQ